MKILVTGALGFIGSNLAERLVEEGHEVTALDNMHTGSESNIERIRQKVRVVKKGSGEIASLGERFDAVFHEGVYSSSPMYKENPHLTAKVLDEWISIFEYSRKSGCMLVYASSSSIYNGNKPPHKEDMPVHITDFYTEGRYAMERVAKLYDDFYGVKSVGLRYFSVYGPNERSKGRFANLITQFLWEMKEGKSPLILGDGSQTRDFTYVGDVVDANMLALKYGKSGVFNVGTGKSVTLNETVALLTYKPNQIKNYVQHTLSDTHLAKKELGFTAKVGIEVGVRKLIEHYYP
jgi:UDP-glucose 4-epimerase